MPPLEESKMNKPFSLQISVPTVFSIRTAEQIVAELRKDNWVGLYHFPLYIGGKRAKPTIEDKEPFFRLPDEPVPLQNEIAAPMAERVGTITDFSIQGGMLVVSGYLTTDEFDFSDPNWEAELFSTPKLSDPTDCVTHVRFNKLGSMSVHAIDPTIFE